MITKNTKTVLIALFTGFAITQGALAQSTAPAAPAAIVGNKDNAKSKVQMCIGCHGIVGYKASFPTVYPVPKIGGQNAKYIESALQAYKAGDRSHPTMRGIAGSLSDQDMADLAAYYSASATTAVASTQPASK
jgi:cytochrome c553